MTTHLALTRTNGTPLAGSVFDGTTSPEAAWDWIASVVARQFDCLPEDVGYDEPGLVTVSDEAVAIVTIKVDNTRN